MGGESWRNRYNKPDLPALHENCALRSRNVARVRESKMEKTQGWNQAAGFAMKDEGTE